MRTGGRVLDDELEHLDPVTGAGIDAEPLLSVQRASIRVPLARWSFGAGLVVATVLTAYGLAHHRAAAEVDRAWASARAERQHLLDVVIDLYEIDQVARLSGSDDHGRLVTARSASAREARRRLRVVDADLRDIRIVDGEMDRMRDRLRRQLAEWREEIDDYASGHRIFLEHDVGDAYVARVDDLRKRWRVREGFPAAVEDLPGVAVLQHLARPVDAPVPAVVHGDRSGGRTARRRPLDR